REPDGLAPLDALHEAVHRGAGIELAHILAEEMEAAPDRLSIYLALAGDAAVAAGWLRLHPGTPFATLEGGLVHPDWRGRGLYRVLVALRGVEAAQGGAAFLTVEAAAETRPTLERLGFLPLAETRRYIHDG